MMASDTAFPTKLVQTWQIGRVAFYAKPHVTAIKPGLAPLLHENGQFFRSLQVNTFSYLAKRSLFTPTPADRGGKLDKA